MGLGKRERIDIFFEVICLRRKVESAAEKGGEVIEYGGLAGGRGDRRGGGDFLFLTNKLPVFHVLLHDKVEGE